jgi:cobalt/nickel transport system permease protein
MSKSETKSKFERRKHEFRRLVLSFNACSDFDFVSDFEFRSSDLIPPPAQMYRSEGNMTLALDIPVCPPSLLQRFDPRWKLASLLIAALGIAWLRCLGPALAALAGTLLLVALARAPWGWYLRRLGTATVMYALFLIWLPLAPEAGDATLDLGWLSVSLTGFLRLTVLSAKLAGMISLILVLLATTPLPDTFKAARALGLPRLLVLLMLLTYRYVFLLIEEFVRLRIALRVRGFRNRANLHSYRTIAQVSGTLLVRGQERADRVGQAMRCRGFDGEFRTLHAFHAGWRDGAAFAAIVGCVAGLACWDWFVR